MLTRKGTLGRRSRASMRRGRGTWGAAGGAAAGSTLSRSTGGSVKGARPGLGGYGATGSGETGGTRPGAKRRSLIQQAGGESCQGQGTGENHMLRAGVPSPSVSIGSISSSHDGQIDEEESGGSSKHHPQPLKGVSFADTVALAGEEGLANRRFSGYTPCVTNKSNFSRNCNSLYNKRGRSNSRDIDKRVSGSCSALMFGLADQYSEFTATGRLSTSTSGPFGAVDSLRQYQNKVGNSCHLTS